ncbi:MAG: hypothetical protein ACN6PV_15090 [Achromobacter sp.]|uniref:hypothetical protein n=1 Tax=Achromobacter sp. TaxID=134375 RepID=UPI000FAB010A
MRLLTLASVMLTFALAGCTAPSSYSSTRATAPSTPHDQTQFHSDNFGEPNNTPFQGHYPGH